MTFVYRYTYIVHSDLKMITLNHTIRFNQTNEKIMTFCARRFSNRIHSQLQLMCSENFKKKKLSYTVCLDEKSLCVKYIYMYIFPYRCQFVLYIKRSKRVKIKCGVRNCFTDKMSNVKNVYSTIRVRRISQYYVRRSTLCEDETPLRLKFR